MIVAAPSLKAIRILPPQPLLVWHAGREYDLRYMRSNRARLVNLTLLFRAEQRASADLRLNAHHLSRTAFQLLSEGASGLGRIRKSAKTGSPEARTRLA